MALLVTVPGARPEGGIAQQEYIEKARYLGTFAKFVEWPSTAFLDDTSPVIIGIVGNDPFGFALERALQGQRVGGRPLAIERFRDASHLGDCSILFVSKSTEAEMPKILGKLAGSSVLTVGDTSKFVDLGGIVGFMLEEGHVRFKINPGAAERAGLKISSRLLVVAKIVADAGLEPR